MSGGRIILFADPSFPGYTAAGGLTTEQAQSIGLHHTDSPVHAEQLAETLDSAKAGDCFVSFHAPYFPKEAWPSIVAYLSRGGSLISIGGAPFKHPVRLVAEEWRIEAEQTAYHRQLHIHEALRVSSTDRIQQHVALRDIPLFVGDEQLLALTDTWNLVPHVTKSSDLPEQMGSSGPMDTRIYPLLKGITAAGRKFQLQLCCGSISAGLLPVAAGSSSANRLRLISGIKAERKH